MSRWASTLGDSGESTGKEEEGEEVWRERRGDGPGAGAGAGAAMADVIASRRRGRGRRRDHGWACILPALLFQTCELASQPRRVGSPSQLAGSTCIYTCPRAPSF